MAFRTSWFSNKIVSTDGYYVRTAGRSAILYDDRTNRLYVGAERVPSANRSAWALYPDDMRFGSPSGRKVADESLRALVVARIAEAFDFMGWRLDIARLGSGSV